MHIFDSTIYICFLIMYNNDPYLFGVLVNLIFTTKFNDSSILITIIPCDCLNLSLADEHVGFHNQIICIPEKIMFIKL
jgi:hypothetical protein